MSTTYEWYTDRSGITRRRKQRGPLWEMIVMAFIVLDAIAILAFVGIFIWAGFDIHERMGYVLIAQIPPIVMMVIRRAAK